MSARRPHRPVEERRAELVEVALRVMARDGAWALTTRAVAREAGVPHGSVHYAFSSKAELIRAVIAADTARARAVLAENDTGTGADAEALLTAAVDRYLTHVLDDPRLELAYHELSLMAARDPDLAALAAEGEEDYGSLFVELLTAVAERVGGTWETDVTEIADEVSALTLGATAVWLVNADLARFRRTLDGMARRTAARLLTR